MTTTVTQWVTFADFKELYKKLKLKPSLAPADCPSWRTGSIKFNIGQLKVIVNARVPREEW